MKLKIQNLIVKEIDFPIREIFSTNKKNWELASKKSLVLSNVDSRLDGKTGDVLVDLKGPEYAIQDLKSGKIKLNEYLDLPYYIDPKIEDLLQTSDKIKLNGKTFNDASVEDLIGAGYIDLNKIKLM